MIVVRVRGGVSVVGAQNQLLHDPLDTRVDIAGHVAGAQVPGDELVRYRNYVPVVGSQAKSKNCELVALQRVLESKKYLFKFKCI